MAAREEGRPITYLNAGHSVWSWLTTTDHKRIALLYLGAISFFFIVGTIGASVVRFELLSPYGMVVSNGVYNRMFTMHGIVMIFLFLVPSIPTVFGNFMIPMMIGARDLAFPRLNLLTWYLFCTGGLCVMGAVLFGGIDTGWTFYTPFSSLYSNSNVLLAVTGIFIAGFASIFTGINFIATIHKLRAPGMTWLRLPLFIWSMYATSIIFVLSTPVVAMTLLLVAVERCFGVGIFSPELGGEPVLFQHLFWFYSHPVVYIMILPAMGVISEVVATFCRKRVFGYYFVAGSSLAIGFLGFLVWGHHMFVSSQSMYSSAVFSLFSFLVAIPSAIKVFNWIGTIRNGVVTLSAPMIYCLGFIGLFTLGGLTGLFLATIGTDVHLTGTYFVVAHFHFIMVGGAMMGYLGALHYWWPKITGRMYPEFWARLAAMIGFAGFILTFMPQFLLGYLGMPRRYHEYAFDPSLQPWHVLSTAGATVLGLGYLLPAIYLAWSIRFGERAPANPWGATTLEWQTESPPPPENFDTTPVVDDFPYVFQPVDREEYVAVEDAFMGKKK